MKQLLFLLELDDLVFWNVLILSLTSLNISSAQRVRNLHLPNLEGTSHEGCIFSGRGAFSFQALNEENSEKWDPMACGLSPPLLNLFHAGTD